MRKVWGMPKPRNGQKAGVAPILIISSICLVVPTMNPENMGGIFVVLSVLIGGLLIGAAYLVRRRFRLAFQK